MKRIATILFTIVLSACAVSDHTPDTLPPLFPGPDPTTIVQNGPEPTTNIQEFLTTCKATVHNNGASPNIGFAIAGCATAVNNGGYDQVRAMVYCGAPTVWRYGNWVTVGRQSYAYCSSPGLRAQLASYQLR